jgi:sodium/potassium-transporting ATPase subunit beta
VKALHLQPNHRRVSGAHGQELGFDLALLPSFLGTVLQTLNDEAPKYSDQIPSPGLTVFPKPATAQEYTFSMSDPKSYEG